MASEEDDIALSLPQPPPPAPARRDAAIREAMRRFDGEPSAASARPEPRRSGSRWSLADRPQLGIMVAASLVAMIGLPLAWLTVSQKTAPPTQMASRDGADLKTFDVEEAPRAPAEPRLPAVVLEPRSVAPEPVVEARVSENAAVEQAAPSPPASETIKTAAPQASAAHEAKRSERFAGALDRAAPVQAPVVLAPSLSAAAPPPPAAAKPQRDAAADSIVVTGARRRDRAVPDRGDWNACTINDPRRSLAACKYLVNPAAKGIKGQAAAHVADGLSFAWQGDIDRAITAFDQAIAIAPKSPLAYLNRGLARRQQGNDDEALADFNEAVRLAPGSARGYYNRSLLLRERGDDRRAKADQARAVDLDADYEAVVD